MPSEQPVVVLDANVLFPAQLRDLLMRLTLEGLFRAHWSDEIHDEWMRAVKEKRPDISKQKLKRTRMLMERALPAARVTDYQALLSEVALPDPKDQHVVAAARKAEADAIVTINVKDFPADLLSPFGLVAIHPDRFVRGLFDTNPLGVLSVVHHHRSTLRRPPLSVDDYLATLDVAGLQKTVEILRVHKAVL